MMCQLSIVESKSATFPTERPRHLLDDSVLECQSPARGHAPSARLANGVSIGTARGEGGRGGALLVSLPDNQENRELPCKGPLFSCVKVDENGYLVNVTSAFLNYPLIGFW